MAHTHFIPMLPWPRVVINAGEILRHGANKPQDFTYLSDLPRDSVDGGR